MAPYVFDTSSFQVLENYYPERFPTFWEKFNSAVEDGMVLSVREVYNELGKLSRNEWLLEWARQQRVPFLKPGPLETQFVAEIFRVPHFRTLVGTEQQLKGSYVADPFVIACARAREGCVVTEEAFKPNAAKIPNICQYFGVECTNVEGFLERMNWEF